MNVATSRWRRNRAARAHAHYHRRDVHRRPEPGSRRAGPRASPRCRTSSVGRSCSSTSPTCRSGEIAAQENVAEGTVKAWLHRGRRRARHPAHRPSRRTAVHDQRLRRPVRGFRAGGPLVVPAGPAAARAVTGVAVESGWPCTVDRSPALVAVPRGGAAVDAASATLDRRRRPDDPCRRLARPALARADPSAAEPTDRRLRRPRSPKDRRRRGLPRDAPGVRRPRIRPATPSRR